MKLLLLIDYQNGFFNDNSRRAKERLGELLSQPWDHIAATKYINSESSPCRLIAGWYEMSGGTDVDLLPEAANAAERVFVKTTFSAVNKELLAYLKDLDADTVYLAGVDTEACVAETAVGLFDHGIRPVVLLSYCASTGGEAYHQAAALVLSRILGEAQVVR